MDFMEIEPKRPERIWAAGYLQRSTDNGVSWLFLNTYSDVFPVQGISSLAFGSIGEVYASQADRIVHSTDDGQTWTMLMKADSAVTLCSVLVDPEDADHTIVSGFSYAEDSKANILSEKTYIYNFENRALRQIYEHDGIVVTRHLRALNNHGLLFGTGGDGVYEITNIMKQ